MLKSTINFFISLLVLILIVDPGDLIFRMKVPLFILILGIWGGMKIISPIKINRDFILIILVFISIPIIGVVSALAQDTLSDPSFAFGFIKSFSVIILLLVIFDLNIPIDKYLVRNSLVIPFIIIPIYIFLSVNPGSITAIFNYLDTKDVAKFSNRDFYGYKAVMLYYRTSPLLVFPLAYYCKSFVYGNKKVLSIILIALFLFTLILSGTRANMVSGFGIVMYFFIFYLTKMRSKVPLILASILLVVAGILFVRSLSFSEGDDSSAVKAGHYKSYKLLFSENPQYLIWGEGLGSKFYSSGNGIIVSQTELTYFDLVRWFGLPLAFVLFFFLFYPILYLYFNNKINRDNGYLVLAYLAYLFIAGTNPLLISSTGLLAIITAYSFVRRNTLESPSHHIAINGSLDKA